MNSLLDYLFPDASEENRYPYPDDLTANHQQFANIKSGPIDGLIWRLSIVFAHCLHILGGLKPLAHLMHEFIMEVRFRYENAIPLPGLPSGSPDHGFCVLHQKLQMINCCIEVKIAREQNKDEKDGMTSLLTHDVAHSTRHSYRPKTSNQPVKKLLSLVISRVKVVKNLTSF